MAFSAPLALGPNDSPGAMVVVVVIVVVIVVVVVIGVVAVVCYAVAASRQTLQFLPDNPGVRFVDACTHDVLIAARGFINQDLMSLSSSSSSRSSQCPTTTTTTTSSTSATTNTSAI